MVDVVVCSARLCEGEFRCCLLCDITDCNDRCDYSKKNPDAELCEQQLIIRKIGNVEERIGILSVAQCNDCDAVLTEFEEENCTYDGESYCEGCYNEAFSSCGHCRDIFSVDELYWSEGYGYYICERCYDNHFFTCRNCSEIEHLDDSYETVDGDLVCRYCKENHYFTCDQCGYLEHDSNTQCLEIESEYLCRSCAREVGVTCEICERTGRRSNMQEHGHHSNVCDTCYEDLRSQEEEEEETDEND